ncbi:TetR/AcrR family transcriptional regulator [Parapedobacter lycopersici]|uniref:TetR/AcrR family transcriptional regulator n=1 Tax=Parapedobacter lycopersici TaxID=1864939 RepID=UPI00333F17E9
MDDKKKQIISAALKRFSHFGITKTSMSEIAEDLKLSKANLYYYFPDKFSLIEAIGDMIMDESQQAVDEALHDIEGTLNLLYHMLDIKKAYLLKYHMLILDLHEVNINDERMASLAKRMFNREVGTISKILKKGMENGELVTLDAQVTSELYVSMNRGLAMFCSNMLPNPVMEKEEIVSVINRQRQVAEIMINGIKRKSA